MNYTGPLPYKTDSNSTEKYWVLLLTCVNTRAIYVDIVVDMSAKTLIHILRRFFATTAYPRWIVCDNSKTFKAIAELHGSFRTETGENSDITDYCAQRKIEFKFIPSYSPWQGGLYEKMIHIFKVSFKHALNNRQLKIQELLTIAKESEAMVNSCPLTYVSEENHVPTLRPIDFLRPWTSISIPRLSEPEREWTPKTTTKEQLIHVWNTTNDMLNRFWKRWCSEYSTSLREQYRTTHPHPRCFNESAPKKNDIVLIHDKNLERGQWQVGQITSSSDDFQRSAKVRLPSRTLITRPRNLLYKFETENGKEHEGDQPNVSPETPTPTEKGHPMMTRSKTLLKNDVLKNDATLFTFIAILSHCDTVSASTRCPSELTLQKTIIYATNCASKGVAIAKHKLDGNDKLCWFPIFCPFGAIQIPIPFHHNHAICVRKCQCPTWATSCSFSTSQRTASSKVSAILFEIASYIPSHVCSFQPSSKCDSRKKIGTFNQVELYDGTLLIVPELHIAIKEYLDPEDFVCFDLQGSQQSQNGLIP